MNASNELLTELKELLDYAYDNHSWATVADALELVNDELGVDDGDEPGE